MRCATPGPLRGSTSRLYRRPRSQTDRSAPMRRQTDRPQERTSTHVTRQNRRRALSALGAYPTSRLPTAVRRSLPFSQQILLSPPDPSTSSEVSHSLISHHSSKLAMVSAAASQPLKRKGRIGPRSRTGVPVSVRRERLWPVRTSMDRILRLHR